MSTHVPGHFKVFLNHFILAKLAVSSIRVKNTFGSLINQICSRCPIRIELTPSV